MQVYFDRFFILMESDSSIEFLGAIRLALIVWPQNITTRNNLCIKAFLITSVYSKVQLLFRLPLEILLTQKTCYIRCSLLVVP